MSDPLAEVVASLEPRLSLSKLVTATAPWLVRRESLKQAFYCAVLEGSAHVLLDDQIVVRIEAGDFLLLPATDAFAMTSLDPAEADLIEPSAITLTERGAHVGAPDAPVDFQALVGHCDFRSPDSQLLVSLLPRVVHAPRNERLDCLVHLLSEEWRDERPAREMILLRLLEVLFVEGLRSATQTGTSPGLLQGLADTNLSQAIRMMHAQPAEPWTIDRLAKAALMSRSAFFSRFSRVVGVAPMKYLLNWRMALAKALLEQGQLKIAQVADRVGYGSATAFSIAFSRHMGIAPGRYGRAVSNAQQFDKA